LRAGSWGPVAVSCQVLCGALRAGSRGPVAVSCPVLCGTLRAGSWGPVAVSCQVLCSALRAGSWGPVAVSCPVLCGALRAGPLSALDLLSISAFYLLSICSPSALYLLSICSPPAFYLLSICSQLGSLGLRHEPTARGKMHTRIDKVESAKGSLYLCGVASQHGAWWIRIRFRPVLRHEPPCRCVVVSLRRCVIVSLCVLVDLASSHMLVSKMS